MQTIRYILSGQRDDIHADISLRIRIMCEVCKGEMNFRDTSLHYNQEIELSAFCESCGKRIHELEGDVEKLGKTIEMFNENH